MAQTVCVVLSSSDRQLLKAIVADRNWSRKHVERAQVVLAAAERGPVQLVAARLGVSRPMVWRWQLRFAEEGADGLLRHKTRQAWQAADRRRNGGQRRGADLRRATAPGHALDRPGDGPRRR